jgi:hypothetical protein
MDVEFTWSAADALVDGKPWPMLNKGRVRLPAGSHVIEPGAARDGLRITDLNATLRRAGVEGKRVTFEYSSDSRAIVRFDRKPARVEVDGVALAASCLNGSDCALLLPRGEHRVSAN